MLPYHRKLLSGISSDWDLSKLSVSSDTYDISSYLDHVYLSVSKDDDILFISGQKNGTSDQALMQFDMSTPKDITTLSYVGEYDIDPELSGTLAGSSFNADGSKFYKNGNALSSPTSRTYEYSLSSPYTLSGISTNDYTDETTYGVPSGIAFGDDGNYLFANVNGSVRRYTLSTAYDYSSRGSPDGGQLFSGNINKGLLLSPSGRVLWGYNQTNNRIEEYILDTPFDLSTIGSLNHSINWSGGEVITSMSCTKKGNIVYVGNNLQEVRKLEV